MVTEAGEEGKGKREERRGSRARAFRALQGALALARERRAELVLTLLLVIFAVVAWGIRTEELRAYDLGVTRAWQSARLPALDRVAYAFTFVGGGAALTPLGILAALVFLWAGRRRTALFCIAALAGHPLTHFIKALFGRSRPEAEAVQVLLPASGLSFPSGHALGSTLFFGFLALLCWVLIPRRAPRIAGTLLFALLPLGVGVSRIYVGAHWFSDVAGGWTAGLFFLLLLARLHERYARPELAPPPPADAPPPKTAAPAQ